MEECNDVEKGFLSPRSKSIKRIKRRKRQLEALRKSFSSSKGLSFTRQDIDQAIRDMDGALQKLERYESAASVIQQKFREQSYYRPQFLVKPIGLNYYSIDEESSVAFECTVGLNDNNWETAGRDFHNDQFDRSESSDDRLKNTNKTGSLNGDLLVDDPTEDSTDAETLKSDTVDDGQVKENKSGYAGCACATIFSTFFTIIAALFGTMFDLIQSVTGSGESEAVDDALALQNQVVQVNLAAQQNIQAVT